MAAIVNDRDIALQATVPRLVTIPLPTNVEIGGSTIIGGIDAATLVSNAATTAIKSSIIYAYKRAGSLPTDDPGEVTYDFTNKLIVTPTLLAGWSKTIPTGTQPLYVVAATAANSGSTDVIAASEWSDPALLTSNGLNAATLQLFQRTTANAGPSLPAGNITYTFASAAISGTLGNWSTNVPSTGGVYLWVTRSTAISADTTDTIAPGEWSTPSLLATDGANGVNGSRGNVKSAVSVASAAWSDAAATAAVLAATGTANMLNDEVTLYYPSTNPTWSQTRYWFSNAWNSVASYINGNMVVDGTLAANKIETNSITSDKIKADTILANSIAAIWSSSALSNVYRDFPYNGITYGVKTANYTAHLNTPLGNAATALYGYSTGVSYHTSGVIGFAESLTGADTGGTCTGIFGVAKSAVGNATYGGVFSGGTADIVLSGSKKILWGPVLCYTPPNNSTTFLRGDGSWAVPASADLTGYATQTWVTNNFSSSGHTHSYTTTADVNSLINTNNTNYVAANFATITYVSGNYSTTSHTHTVNDIADVNGKGIGYINNYAAGSPTGTAIILYCNIGGTPFRLQAYL